MTKQHWGNWSPWALLERTSHGAATMGNRLRVPPKRSIPPPCDSAMPSHIPRMLEFRQACLHGRTAVLNQRMKTAQESIGEWMWKQMVVCPHWKRWKTDANHNADKSPNHAE